MTKTAWAILFVLMSYGAKAQSDYFQQEVHYTIKVSLDDQKHRLSGYLQLRYINHSPDTLRHIYFHLWPNAYKNNHTEFAKQQLATGSLDFYFAKNAERGYIDSLAFSSNGQALVWQQNPDTIDIAKITLAQPLAPNAEVQIETPFAVQIPKTFSRLGHDKQSYQITQWYPKPAVYDREGWHAMPYLDQGEFYSEFGSFDVSITLPKNYIIGATGTLETAAEKAFLQEQVDKSTNLDFFKLGLERGHAFPASDPQNKTVRYTANNVHDFAWFADKRFYVLADKAVLPSGKTVDCYAFFTNEEADLWAKAARYIAQAVEFYSQTVGEYPYSQASAVQAPLGAGGGMEYPMVTVINPAGSAYGLDVVIAHEVGHNWFYGILASNERDYPWMDEGFNSYVESRYTDKFWKSNGTRTDYLAYLYQSHRGAEQAINTHSNSSTSINYFLGAYAKPTMLLRHLEEYLGTELMDKALHYYFDTWRFKHPQPADLQAAFEQATGKNLDWFFKDIVNTIGRVDYAWGKCKHGQCQLKQKGEIAAPIGVGLYNERDSLVETIWVENDTSGKKGDLLPIVDLPEASYYRIDPSRELPEYNRNNNLLRSKGAFRKGIALRVRLLANIRRPEHPTLCLLPVIGYSQYDGAILGLAAYNMPLPHRDWQMQLMPLVGTRSVAPLGGFSIQKQLIPLQSKAIEKVELHLGMRTASSFYNEKYDYFTRYYRAKMAATIELAKAQDKDFRSHSFYLEHTLIGEEKPQFRVEPDSVFFDGKDTEFRTLHRVEYRYKNSHPLFPMALRAGLEYANYHSFNEYHHQIKLSVEGYFRFAYSRLFGVDMRVYAAALPFNTNRDFGAMPLQLVTWGRKDYFYDNAWVARGEQENFASQQIALEGGAFKTPIPNSSYASSNTFIFAINIKPDIPIKLPFRTKWVKFKPYLDLGYFKTTDPASLPNSIENELLINFGFMLDIGDGLAGIYLPLLSNKLLSNQTRSKGNFLRQISFSFNFNKLNPVEFVKRIEF